MQMLKKIFNSDSKYYLELPDEIEEAKPVQAVVKTAEKAVDVVQNKAQEVLDSKPVEKAVETAEQAKEEAQDKVQAVSKTVTQPADKKKATAKKKGSPKSEAKPQAKATPSPKDAGASSFDPPFWVAAMYNNSTTTVNSDGTQAEQTFATENLMPVVTKYRRTPGPSLNKFRDMAKQAKTPKG